MTNTLAYFGAAPVTKKKIISTLTPDHSSIIDEHLAPILISLFVNDPSLQ